MIFGRRCHVPGLYVHAPCLCNIPGEDMPMLAPCALSYVHVLSLETKEKAPSLVGHTEAHNKEVKEIPLPTFPDVQNGLSGPENWTYLQL